MLLLFYCYCYYDYYYECYINVVIHCYYKRLVVLRRRCSVRIYALYRRRPSYTNLMISCSFCSSCFCLCTTDSMISRSSGVRCDRSGISEAILSTQHQHAALKSATTRHNDGAMCVVPCAGTAIMVSPWTRRVWWPYRGHHAGDDDAAAATPT